MVQKTKTTYVSPLTHIFEVKMESFIAASPDGSWDNSTPDGTNWGSGDDNDYGLS